MKRLSLPKIPTRIPVPSFGKAKDKPETEAVSSETINAERASMPVADADTVEQAQPAKKHKFSLKIPMPSIPKPGAPKMSNTNPPLPIVPTPPINKSDKGEKAAATDAASQTTFADSPAKPAERKDKPKMKKLSMPSLSLGGGGAKATDKRILSLTIEGTNIRIVVYHKNAIESWNSVAFDSHLIKMGQVADPEGLGEVIKNAAKDIEPSKCYVVCALPGLRSVSRIINIPNVSKKEMEIVVPREVRRTMTVSEEDNYFHWQVLPATSAQTRVFVLAVPKEPLSSLLRALNQAGMRPKNIDLKPLALMRAVNQRDAIIANCENNSMELVIVADDVPVLIRSVFLGEGVVTQDYAVGRISDELGRTIVTYNEINKERPLDPNVPIYLTGAAAAGVPFALNVAALTGRTVQPLETPIHCPDGFPIAEYMVNLGLILKVI